MNGRHKTGSYPFQKEYAENALLQKGFNEQIITDLVQFILRKTPRAKSQPISILDLCCGDGFATNQLLLELEKQGIKIDKITGIDIAREQIETAQTYSKKDTRLDFKIQNAEEITYTNEFDVVISLFGLHWVDDINKIAKLISLALKPNGNVVFFVPLEKNDFFDLRKKTMAKSEWSSLFNEFLINPFIDNPNDYLEAFTNLFISENETGIAGDQPVYFTNERFIRFLSSWMQEVRYLNIKGVNPDQYLNDLVETIPSSQDPSTDVTSITIDGNNKIRFLEKFFWYHATKDNRCSDNYTLNTSILTTNKMI